MLVLSKKSEGDIGYIRERSDGDYQQVVMKGCQKSLETVGIIV